MLDSEAHPGVGQQSGVHIVGAALQADQAAAPANKGRDALQGMARFFHFVEDGFLPVLKLVADLREGFQHLGMQNTRAHTWEPMMAGR